MSGVNERNEHRCCPKGGNIHLNDRFNMSVLHTDILYTDILYTDILYIYIYMRIIYG